MPRRMSRRRRRLPRILLNAATGASLVLCVATAVLWVRSYRMTDVFRRFDSTADMRTRERRVMSRLGVVAWAEHGGYYSSYREGLPYGRWLYDRHPIGRGGVDRRTPAAFFLSQPTAWQQAGFIYHRGSQDEASWQWPYPPPNFVTGLPYWAACLPLAILPVVRLPLLVGHARAKRQRRRWRAGGRCPACGYDLRATPAPPGRCPECGTLAAARP
jgi:hypothetical protein